MAENKLTHRYIARIGLDAQTPLFVGSGETSLLINNLVQKDHNGLPIIPGTALAGVLRHAMENHLTNDEQKKKVADIFGYQNSDKDGKGARLFFSHACMVIENNKVAEGLSLTIPHEIKQKLDNLPIRQHVRITEKGIAKDQGLFDNEVVYKGIRFVCEIELKGTAEDNTFWQNLLQTIQSPLFRIGQGTRNGYGNLSANVFLVKKFNLTENDDFNEYLNFSPSLNSKSPQFESKPSLTNEQIIHYKLELTPDSTFIFNSGYPDTDVDSTPTIEKIMEYKNDKIKFEEKTLIPATSIKGTLSHRLAFHYNKLQENYSGDENAKTEIDNEAVYQLLGCEANPTDREKDGQRGKIIVDDIFINANNDKIFNHVAIDRFTGGAIDGALFSEKVSTLKEDEKITINIFVENNNKVDETIAKSLENTLLDIRNGLLPLGGMTTKGHGFFTGKLMKGETEITSYHKNNSNESKNI